jgi:hypothetical protein
METLFLIYDTSTADRTAAFQTPIKTCNPSFDHVSSLIEYLIRA